MGTATETVKREKCWGGMDSARLLTGAFGGAWAVYNAKLNLTAPLSPMRWIGG